MGGSRIVLCFALVFSIVFLVVSIGKEGGCIFTWEGREVIHDSLDVL